MKLVSIIIPSYNQGEYLSEALDSILVQTYKNWECIIIDDGSIDNTKLIANIYCSKDSRIHYIFQENQGVVVARNNAIAQSHGEYILPLDADDKIDKSYIEKGVSVLDTSLNIGILYSKAKKFGTQSGEFFLPPFSREKMIIMNCIPNSAIFRRDDFDRVGGYHMNMREGYEDWDLWLSIIELGRQVYMIPDFMCYFRFKSIESRNVNASKKERQLKENVVINHPSLFRDCYEELFSLSQTRSFQVAKKIYKLHKFFLKLFKFTDE